MIIEEITVSKDGFVNCRSAFYTALCCLSDKNKYTFSQGVNWLYGDIDDGAWAISYYLSMYGIKHKDFVLTENGNLCVNKVATPINELLHHSCYLDESIYPLFTGKQSIRELVTNGIKSNQLDVSADYIKDMFCLDSNRFERSVSHVGNERFRAMAAIAYCNNKQVYCFPWLSKMRFEYYGANITKTIDLLTSLKKIVIVPRGRM